MSTQPQQPQAIQKVETSPLITQLAERYGMAPKTMVDTIIATVFPDGKATVPQLMMFLQVASQYRLSPFTKEIYAFPSKGGGVIPIVPIDGWSNIVNSNPAYDGVEFIDEINGQTFVSTTCIIYRKDRNHPTKVTEYYDECKRDTEPWRKWPKRMTRHKSFVQCARIAFSLAGIFDLDEAERIIEVEEHDKPAITRPTRTSATIEAQPVKTSDAPVPQHQTGEAAPVAANQAASPKCFCACCKGGKCECSGKDDFNRCGCEPCKFNVGAPPAETVKNEPANENAGPATQPTGGELFGPGPDAQSSKPAGAIHHFEASHEVDYRG